MKVEKPDFEIETVLNGCEHDWDDDADWPTCRKCHKAKLFLEMIEEILGLWRNREVVWIQRVESVVAYTCIEGIKTIDVICVTPVALRLCELRRSLGLLLTKVACVSVVGGQETTRL
jgi:hypothetical protein